MLKGRYFLAAAGFLALLIGANWYTAAATSAPAYAGAEVRPEAPGGVAWQSGVVNEGEEYKKWTKRIEEEGGKEAYKEFSRYVIPWDYPSRHTLAHTFGQALWETEGLNGIAVCDDRFAYGCFHEYLAFAVNTNGLSVIKTLDETCQTQPTFLKIAACQHGIGHGAVSSIGYDVEDLKEGLEACATLKNPDTMGGCYAGAFMEYNRRSMIAVDVGGRIPEDGDFVSPCNQVDAKYRAVCVLWQPLWWHGELFDAGHSEEDLKEMGEMCRALGEEIGYKETCFYGVGFVSAPETATLNPDALVMCPAAAKTHQEQQWCLNYGAYVASALVDLQNGLRICEPMAPEDKALCERYARTTTSVLTSKDVTGR